MKWEIEFFNEKVKQDTLNFPPKILGKLFFIKKTQKTPKREFEIALSRKKEVDNE
ncbi:hypothetical protein [Hippea sp. KM1]|uniref:hypothetical protein n=1 Tax=Hippea sp. KM1 TaxID=944481 RepID=UPI0018DECADC|nr:hypothetical protein [Hippea sp. KM1]